MAALAFALFARAGGAFVFDAVGLIPENRALIESREWLSWFSRDFYWGALMQDVRLYRPLTVLSYLAQIRTTGVDASWMLLANAGLHAAVSLLVLALGERLVGRRAGVVGALLFAAHPLHTEVVAWVMGRSELLAAALGLAACVSFLRATERGERHPGWWGAGTVGLSLGAMLSKEHVVLLPAWFGLAWWAGRREREWTRAAWIVGGSVAALGVFLLLREGALTRQPTVDVAERLRFVNPAALAPVPERWLTAMAVIARYAGLLLWPARLSSDYSYAQIEVSRGLGWGEAAGLAVVVGYLAMTGLALRRRPGLGLGLGLAPVTFVLVSNIPFAIGTVMAERLTYFPSVGICLGAGWVLARLPWPAGAGSWLGEGRARVGPGWRGWVTPGLIVVMVGALGIRAALRVRDWSDEATFRTSAFRDSPRSVPARASAAGIELSRGNLDRAAQLASEALEYVPDYTLALMVLGEVEWRRGRIEAATALYRRAVGVRPGDAFARAELGILLVRRGRRVEAERELREAIRLNPDVFEGHLGLGWVLLEEGRATDALAEFRAATRLRPRDGRASAGAAFAAAAAGDRVAALDSARQAQALGVKLPEHFWRSLGER